MHIQIGNKLSGVTLVALFLFVTQINGRRVTSRFQFTPRTDIKNRLLTPEEGCGYVKVSNTRILGGGVAKNGAWPWAVLAGYKDENQTFFNCGGSLITSRHVLTAAHCFFNVMNFVRLGEYDKRTESDGPHQDIKIADYETHSDHDDFIKINDIAMIYLEHDVEFTDRVRTVCLPIEEPLVSRDFNGFNPFVVGWGRTGNSSESDVLLQLQVPIIENSECKKEYQRVRTFYEDIQFSKRVICAGGIAGHGSWRGDSGGPLMLPIRGNRTFPFYQIGIVSYQNSRAPREGIPGVYASVQYYADWIKEKLRKYE